MFLKKCLKFEPSELRKSQLDGKLLKHLYWNFSNECETMKMLHVKARESQRCFGPFSDCITNNQSIFTISFTKRRRSQENCMSFVSVRNSQMQFWLQNGRKKDTKSYAVCSAFRKEINNLAPVVFAEFQGSIWKRER